MSRARHSYLYEDYLPQPVPLPKKGISLESDMLLGWRPKDLKSPIPLSYYSLKCKNSKQSIVVYKGYRADDSFIFHQSILGQSPGLYPYDLSDKNITAYNILNRKKQHPAKHGMLSKNLDCLVFDSHFESGNLDRVEMVSPLEYDLYIRPDTNTSGHMHWFYFSVSAFKSLEKVKLNIVNFSRSSSLYRSGMKIKAFSYLKSIENRDYFWEDFGENLSFGYSKVNKWIDCERVFYMLSFEFRPGSINDKIWLALTVPYGYSRLWKVLKTLKTDSCYETSHIEISSLGKSLSLAEIPILTITNPKSPSAKKTIIAIGRVHPAETVGSWVLEGFFRYLCSKNQDSSRLRDLFVFKVIPMCNPDGVIIGNSRTSLNGDDLNRCYTNPNESTQTECKQIKAAIQEISKNEEIFMFIDFHGHFCKKGSFMYGPCYPMHDPSYFFTKILAKLLSERTSIFRYHSSRFVNEKGKNSTARMVFWKELGITNAFTLETSYFCYLSEERETVSFEIKDLYELSENLALAIFEFFFMLNQEKVFLKTLDKRKEVASRKSSKKRDEKEKENLMKAEIKERTLFNLKIPKEKILPLVLYLEQIKQRNISEIVELIKADNTGSDESDEGESCSDSEDGKETELPRIERRISTDLGMTCHSGFSDCSKTKPRLRKRFAARLKRMKARHKNTSVVFNETLKQEFPVLMNLSTKLSNK